MKKRVVTAEQLTQSNSDW